MPTAASRAMHVRRPVRKERPAAAPGFSFGWLPEGGSYPAYTRLNISMACNHCDNPVCLKGCPTRAYTKFAEYGAVLQDPDICFGCGYCTWVCPYNAPQLDTKAGHVSKCNMCVDRLEVGLKPACSSACLAGALISALSRPCPKPASDRDTHSRLSDPEITHPNIRFQQVNSLPREMHRTDSMPIRYERDAQGEGGVYRSKVTEDGRPRALGPKACRRARIRWWCSPWSPRPWSGAFLVLFLGPMFRTRGTDAVEQPGGLAAARVRPDRPANPGLVLSTLHLGRPHRLQSCVQQPAPLAGESRGGRCCRFLQPAWPVR